MFLRFGVGSANLLGFDPVSDLMYKTDSETQRVSEYSKLNCFAIVLDHIFNQNIVNYLLSARRATLGTAKYL